MGNSFIIFLPFICFPSNTKISQLLQTQNFALSWFEIKVFLFLMTRNWETVGPTGWQTRTRAQIRKFHQFRTKIFKFPFFKKKKTWKNLGRETQQHLVRTKKLAGIQKHIVSSSSSAFLSSSFFFIYYICCRQFSTLEIGKTVSSSSFEWKWIFNTFKEHTQHTCDSNRVVWPSGGHETRRDLFFLSVNRMRTVCSCLYCHTLYIETCAVRLRRLERNLASGLIV